MSYIPRNGIILTSVCGKYMLVSAKEYRDFIPKVVEINETAAEIWKLLEERKSESEILDFFQKTYAVENESELETMIHSFISKMVKNGYLIEDSF